MEISGEKSKLSSTEGAPGQVDTFRKPNPCRSNGESSRRTSTSCWLTRTLTPRGMERHRTACTAGMRWRSPKESVLAESTVQAFPQTIWTCSSDRFQSQRKRKVPDSRWQNTVRNVTKGHVTSAGSVSGTVTGERTTSLRTAWPCKADNGKSPSQFQANPCCNKLNRCIHISRMLANCKSEYPWSWPTKTPKSKSWMRSEPLSNLWCICANLANTPGTSKDGQQLSWLQALHNTRRACTTMIWLPKWRYATSQSSGRKCDPKQPWSTKTSTGCHIRMSPSLMRKKWAIKPFESSKESCNSCCLPYMAMNVGSFTEAVKDLHFNTCSAATCGRLAGGSMSCLEALQRTSLVSFNLGSLESRSSANTPPKVPGKKSRVGSHMANGTWLVDSSQILLARHNHRDLCTGPWSAASTTFCHWILKPAHCKRLKAAFLCSWHAKLCTCSRPMNVGLRILQITKLRKSKRPSSESRPLPRPAADHGGQGELITTQFGLHLATSGSHDSWLMSPWTMKSPEPWKAPSGKGTSPGMICARWDTAYCATASGQLSMATNWVGNGWTCFMNVAALCHPP